MKILSNVALAAMAAVALASCQKNEVISGTGTVDNGAIDFTTYTGPILRGTVKSGTQFNDGDAFKVFGYTGTETIFDGVDVTKGADGWSYDKEKFWDASQTYNFRAIHPGALGVSGTEGFTPSFSMKEGKVEVDLPAEASKHQDLTYAVAMGVKSTNRDGSQEGARSTGHVKLNFKHAMAQLNFKAKVDASAKYGSITVKSIEICNLDKKGTFTYPASNGADGTWTLDKSAPNNRSNFPADLDSKEVKATKGEEAVVVSNVNNPMLLIPQAANKWDVEAQPVKKISEMKNYDEKKVYAKIVVMFKDKEDKVIKYGDNTDKDGYTTILMPFDLTLTAGRNHTITFVFGKKDSKGGGAGYDEDGNKIADDDIISFEATLTDFVTDDGGMTL